MHSAAASLLGVGDLNINNPGNIEKTTGLNKWRGEYTCDRARFACFDTMPNGYRAMFVLLRNYINDGYNTITKILNRWAPPFENDTAAYIKNVQQWSGVNANQAIDKDDIDTLEKIVAAMSRMENGYPAVTTDVQAGKELARSRFGEYVKTGAAIAGLIAAGIGIYFIFKSNNG
jgi:hypothetical protein